MTALPASPLRQRTDMVGPLERSFNGFGTPGHWPHPGDRVAVFAGEGPGLAHLGRWPGPRDAPCGAADTLAAGAGTPQAPGYDAAPSAGNGGNPRFVSAGDAGGRRPPRGDRPSDVER